MNDISVSLVIPTRNEEDIIGKNLKEIYNYVKGIDCIHRFELIVSDYSQDSTPQIVEKISESYKEIRLVKAQRKGIGAGLKCGIKAARNEIIMIYPIDMSWELEVIAHSIMLIVENKADFVLGSRGHKESTVVRPFSREVFSKLYNLLVKIFFGLDLSDTQCTLCFQKSKALTFLDDVSSDDAFYQTEILLYARRHNLRIKEIPVVVNDMRVASSNINPISEGIRMLKSLLTVRSQMKRRR